MDRKLIDILILVAVALLCNVGPGTVISADAKSVWLSLVCQYGRFITAMLFSIRVVHNNYSFCIDPDLISSAPCVQ